MSLIQSARLNGHDPYAYLKDVLTRLGRVKSSSCFRISGSRFNHARRVARTHTAQQLKRPVFSRVSELGIRYLPYNQLKEHRETIGRFGPSIKPLMEISQLL